MQKKTPKNLTNDPSADLDTRLTEQCPTQEILRAVLNDTHPIDESIESHLQTCETCQSTMASLSDLDAMSPYLKPARKLTSVDGNLEPPLRAGDLGSIDGIPIEAVIGKGGMGVVYRGRDEKLGRPVAIKLLAYGGGVESRERFLRETKALSKLEHPNVVSIYSAGEAIDGRPWICMPLIEGNSLKARIGKNGLGSMEAAKVIRQVALGLDAAHKSDLLHRDIKPANVLLDEKNDLAKLADFGLVRHKDSGTMTRADIFFGTPEYASPEQITDSHSTDQRSDVYSLGITLYECLTGITPFRGKPLEVIEQHHNSDPIPPRRLNSGIPIDLQNVCLKAMERAPANRYASAQAFADDLGRFIDGIPVQAKPISAIQKAIRWCARNKPIAGLAGTSLILLLILAVGSTIASFLLNNSNQLLQIESQKATHAEQEAQASRDVAVDTLNNLIDDVYGDLTNNAASIKSREALANSVIDGMESLLENSSDRTPNEGFWRAHVRIGELAELQGQYRTAIEYYRLAIEICEQASQSEHDEWDPEYTKASTSAKLAIAMVRAGHEDASNQINESKTLLQQLDTSDPEVANWLLNLDVQFVTYQWQNFPNNKRAMVELSEKLEIEHDSTLNSDIESQQLLEILNQFYFHIGRAYLELGSTEKAQTKFDAGRKHIDCAVELAPENQMLQSQLAITMRAQGMAASSLGSIEQSIEYISGAISILEDISESDPDDLNALYNLANTRNIYSTVQMAAGETEDAIATIHAAVAGHRKYVETNNNSVSRSVLWDSYTKCASFQFSVFDWKNAFDISTQWKNDFELFSAGQELGRIEELMAPVMKDAFVVADILQNGKIENATASANFGAAMWLARQAAANATKLELSDESLNSIGALYPDFDGTTLPQLFAMLQKQGGVHMIAKRAMPLYEAGAYALIYNNLKASGDESTLVDEIVELAMNSIKKGVVLGGPAALASLEMSFDLNQIKNEPQYQEYVSGVKDRFRPK